MTAPRLLVVEASGRVGVWDLRQAADAQLFAAIPAGALDAAFAPDGRSLLTVGFDGRVRRWTTDGRLVWASHEGHAGPARAIAVTSDLVVSGGDDAIIRRWTADGSPLGEPLAGHEAAVVSLDVSPRGEIASVAATGRCACGYRPPRRTAYRRCARRRAFNRRIRPTARRSPTSSSMT